MVYEEGCTSIVWLSLPILSLMARCSSRRGASAASRLLDEARISWAQEGVNLISYTKKRVTFARVGAALLLVSLS